MKKILTLIILLYCHSAHSNDDIPLIKNVNCDNLKIKIGGVNENIYVYTEVEELGVFPEPSNKIYVGDFLKAKHKKYRIECPKVKISYDGNKLSIVGDTFDSALEYFYNGPKNTILTGAFKDLYNHTIPLYSNGSYEFPNLEVGFRGGGYKINLRNLELEENSFILKEPKDYGNQYQVLLLKNAIIGYSVDNAPMKPYFYNSVLYSTQKDFSDAKKIEIYHKRINKNDIGIMFEKIELDKANNSIKLFKKIDNTSDLSITNNL